LRVVTPSRRASGRPRLGQHFLRSEATVGRILDALGAAPGGTVVEIGPGKGALTGGLLDRGVHVVAFELDPFLASRLLREFAGRPLWVSSVDALKADFAAAITDAGSSPPVPLVGNLPYESATPMIRAFVRRPDLFSRIVVMIQKEVADRLVASSRDAAYGYLTVDVGVHATSRRLFDVGPREFDPPPKVVSTVVEILPQPAASEAATLLAVASAGFQTRRKTLVNSLTALWGRERAIEAVAAAGLLPTARAEELPLETFGRLAALLGEKRQPV
jgi:16S rRNA (adenine1518-N6/adenine1519-N6)-dimethyltransferase